MSRIYFHTKEDTVGVSGAERAAFSIFCEQIASPFLDRYADGGDPLLLQLFPEDHYIRGRAHYQAQALYPRCPHQPPHTGASNE